MVTRSSLVWVMTGIAAGIAGGYLWNRERTLEVPPPTPAELRNEPVRSPFTQRREHRPNNYLTQPAATRQSGAASSGHNASSEFSHRQTVYESASHADLAQLDSLIVEARGLTNPLERRTTLEILLLRYAEIDADAAIGKALDNDRETATRLLSALAATVPELAWQRASEVTNAAERLAYLRTVSEAWVAQDAERAFAKITELPADWQRAELLRSVSLDIADRDPRLAIRLAQTQPPSVSGALMEQIAALWSRNNPSEAARWVESLPRPEQGRYAYRVAEPYLAQKPSEALMWAQRLAASPRKYLWSSMLGQMAKYDPDQALQLAQTAESPAARSEAMGKVLAAIAQTNPSMAMTQLLKLPQSEMRSEILGEVAQSVATLTPGAALDWLNAIADKSMRTQAAQSLGYALARHDVEAAADMVDRVPKEARASWITSVALAYAEVDFEKGRQWIRRYANEPGDAAFQFARLVASRSPEQAVQLVDGIVDDKERDRLLRGLLPPLAEHSPAVAARWAERVTDDEQRERSIGEVAAVWSQYDLPAARKWILSLDDGPAKDSALQQLVIRGGSNSVDDVVPLINQIQTPERRAHAVLMAAMQLAQTDVDGARTLLRRYPLDPARQRQFDEFLQRRNKGQ
jgi:hypothetical protein